MSNEAFPFSSTWEAWGYFTRQANVVFNKIIEEEAKTNPEIITKIKTLKNIDYCARLIYILNLFANIGDEDSEFLFDHAVILAKPMSAAQARQSIQDLVNLGLMAEIDNERPNSKQSEKYSNTEFDFD